MKVLAIGDCHTKSWIIHDAAEVIDFYDKIVFCGDYSDNFNTEPLKSIGTWKTLHTFMKSWPDKVQAVIGNHDYAYVHQEISGRSSGWDPITFTLLNSPENRFLKDWLFTLPVTFELDGVTFSHAGITEEWDGKEEVMSLWNDVSPIWARPAHFGGHINYKNIPQVFGHNPSETCTEYQKDVWCIDTFSEDQNNNRIGDQTMLEIIDGKEFKKIDIKNIHENNSSSSSVENKVS